MTEEAVAPAFVASEYWERRYQRGGNSGSGSYNRLASYKNQFLNAFTKNHNIDSIVELGCGDGNQLINASYKEYHGYDVSATIIEKCRSLFSTDDTKTFYTGDVDALPLCDLSMSLDVVYHLTEDEVYFRYLATLFAKARRFVVIYGNDIARPYRAGRHVKLRDVPGDILALFPEWELVEFDRNPYYSDEGRSPDRSWANFFVYRRRYAVREGIALAVNFEAQRSRPVQPDAPADVTYDFRIPADSPPVTSVERSNETQMQLLDGIARSQTVDVTGFVPNGELRSRFFYFTRATHPKLVVSLTTIRSRMPNIRRVIESILSQSLPADAVVLAVSEDRFLLDEGIDREAIDAAIGDLVRQGLVEVVWTKNTGPYRKLLPAAERYHGSNTCIVTADDDVIYPRDWLLVLYREYLRTGCSTTFRGRQITYKNNEIEPYANWRIGGKSIHRISAMAILPTGKNGVLYHQSHIGEQFFDAGFREVAPTGDDLAFKACLLIQGVGTRRVRVSEAEKLIRAIEIENVILSRRKTLWRQNANQNDQLWQNLISYVAEKYGVDIPTLTGKK
jgi:SAM-dependent methyltransferase